MATRKKDIPLLSEILPAHRLDYYQTHPVAFVEDYIFPKEKDGPGKKYVVLPQQAEMLWAIANNKRVTVSAGRGVGKSAALAWMIIWWHSVFSNALSAAFSPSFSQLMTVLWPELARWLDGSLLAPYFEHTAKKFYLKESAKTNFSVARSAAKIESASGLHAKNMLIMIDEASGVEDIIYNTLQGSLTGPNNKIITMSNPTRTSGFFFDSHHRYSRFWKTLTLSSEDSPIVGKDFLAEMRDKYVTPTFVHDMYRVHVLGLFPEGDPDSFLKLADVYEAMIRKNVPKVGPVELGVDVARKGDDLTVIAVRQGMYVYSAEELGIYDKTESGIDHLITTGQVSKGNEVVDFVLETVKKVREVLNYEDVIRVKVDATGVGGPIADYLELDEENNIDVVPVVFSLKKSERYADIPSKMWGNIRDLIHSIRLPNDTFLMEELSTRRWTDEGGKIKIESKKTFKVQYGSSPDRADALILAFADIENQKRIIKGYDYRESINSEISADTLTAGSSYTCIYALPGQRCSAVWLTWFNGQLRVVDEFTGNTADVIDIMAYKNNGRVLGSPNMFKVGENDMYGFFIENGFFIQEPFGYNELSAVNALAYLGNKHRLVVASECKTTIDRMRTWTPDREKFKGKDHFAINYAITLAVFDLITINEIRVRGNFTDNYIPKDGPLMDVNAGFLGV